jgi:hypothetical protein
MQNICETMMFEFKTDRKATKEKLLKINGSWEIGVMKVNIDVTETTANEDRKTNEMVEFNVDEFVSRGPRCIV